MELYEYYNLDECIDKKAVVKALKSFQKEGKLEYTIERELLHIEDIDLDLNDIQYLSDIFDENDVMPDPDRTSDDNDDDDYYGYGDYDDDEY